MRRDFIFHSVLSLFVGGCFLFIIFFAYTTNLYIETTYVLSQMSQPTVVREVTAYVKKVHTQKKPLQRKVKGIYLTAYSAGTKKKMDEIITLLDQTELNAVVIDIKDYSGRVLYDSQVTLVKELGLKTDRLGDVQALIKRLHDKDIYVIARQTVFQDPILAEKNPEWAIKRKSGGLWRDYKGLAWVDPTQKQVWEYNVTIAREAISLGFDEINFDYVRFPSDGNMSQVIYTVGDKEKYEIMGEFFAFLGESLGSYPAWISIDMFGLVMDKYGKDDMNIGQRLVDAVEHIDYICPMMYPSHYPSGYLGLANPADYPQAVFAQGLKIGSPAFIGKKSQLRPWIQAFNLGAVYDGYKIRAQIEETEKYTDAGWLLWNASNRYTKAGLLRDSRD